MRDVKTLSQQTATKEEYLQAIWTLSDEGGPVIGARVAGFLHVSPASVSEMVHRLEREGLLAFNERKEISLTSAGHELGASIVRRHRLIERMLVDMFGYEWWATHEEAERLEHAISPEMERRLIEKLGDPEACPHGNPMPGTARRRWSQPLGQAPLGEPVVLERIPDQFENEPGFLRYLDTQGLRPGTTLRVLERDGVEGIAIEIEGTRRRIRSDCGAKVWVRPA